MEECRDNFSPLQVALYFKQTAIAKYFFNVGFLLESDKSFFGVQIDTLPDIMREMVEEAEKKEDDEGCGKLIYDFTKKLLPLSLLAFMKVSHGIGFVKSREKNVMALDIPPGMKKKLLFRL